MLNNGCQRDSKGRFLPRALHVVQAPSYMVVCVGMDRVRECVAVAVAAPTAASTAPVAVTVRRALLPRGAAFSFLCWLLVMVAACGYAAHNF